MGELTATAYVILAHLAVQPWSAYDLARQMTRGFDLIWPRAESAMYVEPKKLVAQGLARVTTEVVGTQRSRTIYAITPKGRRALRAWIATPPSAPSFESEALARVIFAERGSKEDLLRAVESIGAHGRMIQDRMLHQMAAYLADGGPFPQRWHTISLVTRFLLEQGRAYEQWARWAADEIEQWPSTDPDVAPRGAELFRQSLELFAPLGTEP